jgi:hypothetical protein
MKPIQSHARMLSLDINIKISEHFTGALYVDDDVTVLECQLAGPFWTPGTPVFNHIALFLSAPLCLLCCTAYG